MEPWFGNHGNIVSDMKLEFERIMLQWSRGSVTTETRHPGRG